MQRIRKIVSIISIISILFVQVVSVRAQEVPTQTPPPEIASPQTPSASDPPQAAEPNLQPAPSLTPTAPETQNTPSQPVPGNAQPSGQTPPAPLSPTPSSNQVVTGNTGETVINTGGVTNEAVVETTVNTNTATSLPAPNPDLTSTNEPGSTSTTVSNTTSVVQKNNTQVTNSLTQTANTGGNSAQENVGNVTVATGDANIASTVITSVNSNLQGVSVSGFNIADEHIGDLALNLHVDCIENCQPNVLPSPSVATPSATLQLNDATITNEIALVANSGGSEAAQNIGDKSAILTGDTNISANILTFANNNIAGNVSLGVVNIFGKLVGDIVLAQPQTNLCDACASPVISTPPRDAVFQSNGAEITNSVSVQANTGLNTIEDSLTKDSLIQTGSVSTNINNVNVANNNISGSENNWWMVVVNNAGSWVGKIIGAPDGATTAGSLGTQAANTSTEQSNVVAQANRIKLENNLAIVANTGGNKISESLNNESLIKTGNVHIMVNLLNFVNNNISGAGRMGIALVNVFGEWIGDFVPPGVEKQASAGEGGPLPTPSPTPSPFPSPSSNTQTSEDTTTQIEDNSVQPTDETAEKVEEAVEEAPAPAIVRRELRQPRSRSTQVASFRTSKPDIGQVLSETIKKNLPKSKASPKKPMTINLAWLVLVAPPVLAGGGFLLRRKLFSKPQDLI